MTTKEMIRCKKCSLLVINDKGELICGEDNVDIHEMSDEDCPVENDDY